MQIRRNHNVDDYTQMMTQQSMRHHACDDTDFISCDVVRISSQSTSLFVVVLTGRRCGDADLSVGARNANGKDGHPERLPANSDTPGRLPLAWYALARVGEPGCSPASRASVGTQIVLAVADELLWMMFRRGVSSPYIIWTIFSFAGQPIPGSAHKTCHLPLPRVGIWVCP